MAVQIARAKIGTGGSVYGFQTKGATMPRCVECRYRDGLLHCGTCQNGHKFQAGDPLPSGPGAKYHIAASVLYEYNDPENDTRGRMTKTPFEKWLIQRIEESAGRGSNGENDSPPG